MKAVGIFEVKTKISEICETVKESCEPILITKRGVPMVKIIPIESHENQSDIWIQRDKFINTHGIISEELPLPTREVETITNPLDD